VNKLNRKEVIILLVGVVFFIGWCTGNQTEEIGSEEIEVTSAKRKPARTPDEIVADLYEDAIAKDTPNERKARAEAKKNFIEAEGVYEGYNSFGKHFIITLKKREFLIEPGSTRGLWYREGNRIEMVVSADLGWYYELSKEGLSDSENLYRRR
jgi:hypothetical protein